MHRRSLLLAATVILLSACNKDGKIFNITLQSQSGSKTVNLVVELADTVEERAKGLMNRETLPENQGMLFVFENPEAVSFWMQDTLIPLDIMFFDPAGVFINAYRMEPCEEDPCPQYASAEPAMFAIEANAGFREEQGITTGWKLNMKELEKIVEFK